MSVPCHKDKELHLEKTVQADGSVVIDMSRQDFCKGIPSRKSKQKEKGPCGLDFRWEWRILSNPPSVMNEIRICRPYMYYYINEMCLKYGKVLKEF